MKAVLAKLTAITICECGEPVIHDDIAVGTEYRVYPETVERGFVYRCGKCGKVRLDVAVIQADFRDGSGRRGPLPLAMFDLILLPGEAA